MASTETAQPTPVEAPIEAPATTSEAKEDTKEANAEAVTSHKPNRGKRGGKVGGRGGGGGRRGGGPRVVRNEDLEDGDERITSGVAGSTPNATVEAPEQAEKEPAEKTDKPETFKNKNKDKGKEKEEKDNEPAAAGKPASASKRGGSTSGRGRGGIAGYVNPDRINTGGMKNERMSAAELDKVMEQRKLQNEAIRQKRELVEADESSFQANIAAETERQKAERLERNRQKAAEREERAVRTAQNEADKRIQDEIDAQRAAAAQRNHSNTVESKCRECGLTSRSFILMTFLA
ncbi:hypothetical protein FRC02_005810 [Tulasnella sp. 418]|nr:hypothetical protein FRC02_005810 [Tulasnella sp. 418]